MSTTPDRNLIPPITAPLGKFWDQPSPALIEIDDSHALMSRATFEALAEYSSTWPSGVYPGKMWSRHDGAHDATCPEDKRRWLLCWWRAGETPERCALEYRDILIA